MHHIEVNQSVGIEILVDQRITQPDCDQLANLLAAHIPVLIVESVAETIRLGEDDMGTRELYRSFSTYRLCHMRAPQTSLKGIEHQEARGQDTLDP